VPFRRSRVRAARKGNVNRPAGLAKRFSQRVLRQRSVGAADTDARGKEKICGHARGERSERPVADPTTRRKLTKAGKGEAAVQTPR